MGFWNDWYTFLKSNAKKNMKRFSITVGAFIFLVISSLALPLEVLIAIVYAGAVQTSGIIIMSLFGKNGNGAIHNQLDTKDFDKNHDLTESKELIGTTSNETKEPIINERTNKIPI